MLSMHLKFLQKWYENYRFVSALESKVSEVGDKKAAGG
jgi:hypothetical protein